MTEAEWLACGDPRLMLDFMRDRASARKARLYGCGRCRLFNNVMPEREIAVAERYADGQATETEREVSFQAARQRMEDAIRERAHDRAVREGDVRDCNRAADGFSFGLARYGRGTPPEEEACRLFREVFGNPFRPVTVDPSWLTSDVVALATGIYQERAFDRLPILADALQDAGCDNDDLLNHLRGDGPHVLGCWALDLVLGKS